MSNGVNTTRDKISSLEELVGILECARTDGKKVDSFVKTPLEGSGQMMVWKNGL